jgi:hypothetical protein
VKSNIALSDILAFRVLPLEDVAAPLAKPAGRIVACAASSDTYALPRAMLTGLL